MERSKKQLKRKQSEKVVEEHEDSEVDNDSEEEILNGDIEEDDSEDDEVEEAEEDDGEIEEVLDLNGSDGEEDDEEVNGSVEEEDDESGEEADSEDQEDDEEEEEDDSENEEDDGEEEQDQTDDEEEEATEKAEPTAVNKEVIKKSQEYVDEEDTSDEEDIRNTVGNVPKNWYDDQKHFGYDWDGNKLMKGDQEDKLDEFLRRMEDPDFWRTVKDPQTGKNVILSEEDIDLIKRIRGQKVPDANFQEYEPWIEWFSSQVEQMPIRKFPEHKRSFLPSRTEAQKVSKLVHALKMGWIKTRAELEKLRAKKEPQFYMLWETDDQSDHMRRIHNHIQAPKRLLPGHAESYNPPPEYLFDAKELKAWHKQKNTPWKRKLHFVPQKFDTLRKVPSYPRYIKERFLRCLDLYLCPRALKMKLRIDPESLVPKLPSPRDLQPFPSVLAIEYRGHADMVRSISTDHTGQYLVSGSDDGTVKIWEVNTGRCLRTVHVGDVVRCVEWCPNAHLSLVVVASGNRVLLLNPLVGDHLVYTKTDQVLKDMPNHGDQVVAERVRTTVKFVEPTEEEYERGVRMILEHFKEVTQVTFHPKGDYFASVMPDGANRSVLISQISRRRSQIPFTKSKGLVQRVLFHPQKPYLFVATQRHIRVYDLVKQTLMKKLLSNCKWISSMAIHPLGDNLLVGSYDRKLLWFDLDLSTKPYQTLRLHGTAVRGVAYHKRYPLFASGADDRSLIISHGMVYNDLLQNPLIVPLKRLQNHEPFNDFGIFGVHFHPWQPWVFSSGADATIKLYTN